MELVGHSTAAAKTTADCVRFDRIVTATTERGPPGSPLHLKMHDLICNYVY